jgi:hypothetical protein
MLDRKAYDDLDYLNQINRVSKMSKLMEEAQFKAPILKYLKQRN